MAKKEYTFDVVCQCENLYIQEEKTFAEIAQISGISEVQIQRWAAKYEWRKRKEGYKQRFLKAHEEAKAITREEILLQDLTHQRDLLKNYFDGRETLEKGDIQAMYAYTNVTDSICKILADMRKRDEAIRIAKGIDRPQMFLDFMRDLVSFLKDRDPDSLPALEKNFDELAAWGKEKYA